MSTYVIGDIHGRLDALERLLDRIAFDASEDRLWFVGDLVNNGPDSVGVLRAVRALGEAAVVVLGNHDLHLLAVDAHAHRLRDKDTFSDVLEAADRPELMAWLRGRKLAHFERGFLMVHAGVLPAWDVETTLACAGEVEQALRGPEAPHFLERMYGNEPRHWREDLEAVARTRLAVNALTRMRVLRPDGSLDFKFKGIYDDIPDGHRAWFDAPDRRTRDVTVLTGHWSALGLLQREDFVGLDSGCAWGRQLSAFRLEDRRVFQVECGDAPA